MSGRSGYANGYGYSDAGQYDRNDGGYGNLGVNGYSGGSSGGGGGGRGDYRPGGYGGFYPEPSQQPPPLMPAAQSPDRRRDHSSSSRSRTREADDRARLQVSRDGRHPADANWGSSGRRDRSETGLSPSGSNARGAQAVEGLNLCPLPRPLGLMKLTADLVSWFGFTDVLRSIQREWDFMASDDCVPVQVALSLMDTSTLGKADREPEFLNVHDQIQTTLKSIVNGW